MTAQTFLTSDRQPALPPLGAGDIISVAHFGHAVDMAIFDLARGRQANMFASGNLRELTQILWTAGTQIVGQSRSAYSSTTTGFVRTVEQRGLPVELSHMFDEAIALARHSGFASTGNLSDDESRQLTDKLVELASLSLTAGGIPSTVESYEAEASQAMRTAALARF